jgi:MFS family permease
MTSTATHHPASGGLADDIEKLRRRAVVASTVGTVIEWYDFGLYGLCAGLVFSQIFFPKSDPTVGVLSAFAVFAVGYIARPLGALMFGHFGDRIGRKSALVATVLLMGAGTFLVGFVPSYASIGIWGAVALCVLRMLQGIGVGGEWSGSILVAMEWAKGEKRSVFASWPQIGVPAGTLAANLAIMAASYFTGNSFMTWGWRLPFVASFLLVIVGLWIRLGLEETPVFREIRDQQRMARKPLLEALRTMWRQIIAVMFLRVSELASFIIYSVYVFTFAVHYWGFSRNFILAAVLAGLCAECVTVPIAGALADRLGRKRVFMAGVVLTGIMSFIYFAGFATGSPVVITLVIVLAFLPHGIQYGAEGALIAEAFPARLRYSGSSIGYQFASVIGGGIAPFIATALFARDPHGFLIAAYLAVTAVISLVAASFVKERYYIEPNAALAVAPIPE